MFNPDIFIDCFSLQVLQLAKELAAAHRQVQLLQFSQMSSQQTARQDSSAALRAAAEDQARAAALQQTELQGLRQRLQVGRGPCTMEYKEVVVGRRDVTFTWLNCGSCGLAG